MNDARFEREVAPTVSPVAHRTASACPVEWGNCSDDNTVYWGKPTDTPHRCNGSATHIRRGLAKLHVCEKCKSLGGQTAPSPYSKAGAQLRAAIMQHEGAK